MAESKTLTVLSIPCISRTGGKRHGCYRYVVQLKHTALANSFQVTNADSYNSMAIEMYYKQKYFSSSAFQWSDPIDPSTVDGATACPALQRVAMPPFLDNNWQGPGSGATGQIGL